VEIRSGQVGVRKPGPEIYRLTADRLGVRPDECVFVDDIPANVEGARAVGMWALLHRDSAITVPKLESLLDLELS
jgi:HAD superfamily hydrolase (TIGR01509 family)